MAKDTHIGKEGYRREHSMECKESKQDNKKTTHDRLSRTGILTCNAKEGKYTVDRDRSEFSTQGKGRQIDHTLDRDRREFSTQCKGRQIRQHIMDRDR